MFRDLAPQEYREALDRLAEQLLWEAGVGEPPVDALQLANLLGVHVVRDAQTGQRGRLVRLAAGGGVGQATILLGYEPRHERRQWAVAHELGECMTHRALQELDVPLRSVSPHEREQLASDIAARLLLPLRWFRKAGIACDWDLLELKRTFSTASHELIARRLLDLPHSVVVTVLDQERITWRRASQLARRPGPLLAAEQRCWQQCHASQAPTATAEATEFGDLVVRCWPVHEPGWRREIVRLDLPEAG